MKLVKNTSVVIIVIIGIMACIYISKSKLMDKSAAAEVTDADLAFGVFGDIHNNTDSFQEAIHDLYKINPSMDALVLNGDNVGQGIEEQYNSLRKAISKNESFLPKLIIKNIGNHEFFDYDIDVNSPEQVQTFINRYLEFSGEDKVYHDKWVKDYHFISLGSEDGNSETINSVTASISEGQLKWLKEKLTERYEKGKPIFVFLHQPLDSGNSGWVGVQQSTKVREILSQYPEVILFTSHTHRDLDESSVASNEPFTMVHTGAIDYTIIPDQNSKGGRRQEHYIKGLYIEVKGNKVTIKGRDMKEKKWIFTKEIDKTYR